MLTGLWRFIVFLPAHPSLSEEPSRRQAQRRSLTLSHSANQKVHRDTDHDVDGRASSAAGREPPLLHGRQSCGIELRVQRSQDPRTFDAAVAGHDELDPHGTLYPADERVTRVARLDFHEQLRRADVVAGAI